MPNRGPFALAQDDALTTNESTSIAAMYKFLNNSVSLVKKIERRDCKLGLSRSGVRRRNAREKRQYGARVAVPKKDSEWRATCNDLRLGVLRANPARSGKGAHAG